MVSGVERIRAGAEEDEGTISRILGDIASRIGSVALIAFSIVFFLAGAIGGITMIGRLGGAGWVIYVVVISTYALIFGPVIASAVTLHQSGSTKYRDEQRRRIEEQRRKFGLHLRTTRPDDEE
jgi:hypothetical protein